MNAHGSGLEMFLLGVVKPCCAQRPISLGAASAQEAYRLAIRIGAAEVSRLLELCEDTPQGGSGAGQDPSDRPA
jgi:hypothetical protein